MENKITINANQSIEITRPISALPEGVGMSINKRANSLVIYLHNHNNHPVEVDLSKVINVSK